jgi:peptide chain release factor 1
MERIEKYCYTRKDFKIDWFSGTGPGGQNRNKVQACCRITHIPSGFTAVGQTERTRNRNFSIAFQNLSEKLEPWIRADMKSESMVRTTSDETIRTYHMAENRIVDHESGLVIPASSLEKRFGDLLDARLRAMVSR